MKLSNINKYRFDFINGVTNLNKMLKQYLEFEITISNTTPVNSLAWEQLEALYNYAILGEESKSLNFNACRNALNLLHHYLSFFSDWEYILSLGMARDSLDNELDLTVIEVRQLAQVSERTVRNAVNSKELILTKYSSKKITSISAKQWLINRNRFIPTSLVSNNTKEN